ncbi:MAG: hypothetical protein Q9202_001472 [Teloschistes flavicans]
MGVMISPFLGGLVYEKAGYYSVCAMGLSVIAVDFLLRLVLIERKDAEKYRDQAHPEPTTAAGFGTFGDGSTASRQHTNPERNVNSHGGEINRQTGGSEHESHSKSRAREAEPLLPSSQVATPSTKDADQQPSGLTRQFPVLVALLRSPKIWTALYGALLHLAIITSFDAILPRFVNLTFGWGSLNGGTGLNMLLAPLASEMSIVVDELGKKSPGTMGSSKSYAQAYSLFNCALAGGQLVGPSLAGLLYDQTNWTVTVGVLAAICASGAVPVAFCTTGPLRPRLGKDRSGV